MRRELTDFIGNGDEKDEDEDDEAEQAAGEVEMMMEERKRLMPF
jgi:hypothetical protein